VSSAARPIRKWQIGVAAGAATLAALSLWANWDGLRTDYWRSRLERSGEPRAAEELLATGRAGEDALVEVLRGADSAEARVSAASALSGARPRSTVVRALSAAAKDPSSEVRRSAAGALAALGAPVAPVGEAAVTDDGPGGVNPGEDEDGRDG